MACNAKADVKAASLMFLADFFQRTDEQIDEYLQEYENLCAVMDAKDDEGRNLMHIAAREGQLRVVEDVFAMARRFEKEDPSQTISRKMYLQLLRAKDTYGSTPLLIACKMYSGVAKTKEKTLQNESSKLLERKDNALQIIEFIFAELREELHLSLKEKRNWSEQEIKQEIEQEIKRVVCSPSRKLKMTALHWCAWNAMHVAIDLIVPYCDTWLKNSRGETALRLAGERYMESLIENSIFGTPTTEEPRSFRKVIKLLVDNALEESEMQECASWSCFIGHYDALKSFLECNKQIVLRFDLKMGTRAYTAIHLAALAGRDEILKLLITKGKLDEFNINVRDSDDRTPLHYAIFTANSMRPCDLHVATVDTIKLLMRNGAMIESTVDVPRSVNGATLREDVYDTFGYQPIDYAKRQLSTALVPDPDTYDDGTPLFQNLSWFYGEFVKLENFSVDKPHKVPIKWRTDLVLKIRLRKRRKQPTQSEVLGEPNDASFRYKVNGRPKSNKSLAKRRLYGINGANAQRILNQLSAATGLRVVELFGNDDGAKPLTDYYILVRAEEESVADLAEASRVRIARIFRSTRGVFRSARQTTFMPFSQRQIARLVRERINQIVKRNDIEDVFRIHDPRTQATLARHWLPTCRCYPMHRLGLYLSDGRELKYPELDLMRSYLGGKVTLYFAFVSLYTSYLFLAVIPCLLVLAWIIFAFIWYMPYYFEYTSLHDLLRSEDLTASQLADAEAEIASDCLGLLNCTSLSFTNVVKLSVLGDTVPVMTGFICIWVTAMSHAWVLKQSELMCNWGMHDQTDAAKVRPEFAGDETCDYASGKIQKSYSKWRSTKTKCLMIFPSILGTLLICVSLGLVWTCNVIFVNCRHLHYLKSFSLFADESEHANVTNATHTTFIAPWCPGGPWAQDGPVWQIGYLLQACVYLTGGFIVYCINALWGVLMTYMNECENHRTDQEFENSFVWKTFWFQLINVFVVPMWSLVVNEQPAGMIISVLSIMVVQIAGDLLHDCGHNCGHKCKQRKTDTLMDAEQPNYLLNLRPYQGDKKALCESPLEQLSDPSHADVRTVIDTNSLRDEDDTLVQFVDVMIQLGFVTFWTGVCPFVPFLAWIHNLIKIRSEAKKVIYETKLSGSTFVNGIASFRHVMQVMAYVGILISTASLFWTWGKLHEYAISINSLLIQTFYQTEGGQAAGAPPSVSNNRPTPELVAVLIIIFLEHVFVLLKLAIDKSFPKVEGWVAIELAKRDAKKRPSDSAFVDRHSVVMHFVRALNQINRQSSDEARETAKEAIANAREIMIKRTKCLESIRSTIDVRRKATMSTNRLPLPRSIQNTHSSSTTLLDKIKNESLHDFMEEPEE